MMIGDIGYDDLYYPFREEIAPKNFTIVGTNGTVLSLHMDGADITTHVKAQYYPVTAQIMVTLLIFLLSIVIINLLQGLAVSDVQVHRNALCTEVYHININ